MLPETLLSAALDRSSAAPNVVSPRYLNASDHPWLRTLLAEYRRFAGKRRAELDARLREPLPTRTPAERLQRARHVLDRACVPEGLPPKRAATLREALFLAAADRKPRQQSIEVAAKSLGIGVRELQEGLFADLPAERRLPAPPEDLDEVELALRTNLALVQGLCARSSRLVIDLWGNARTIVRLAQLRGLLCTARAMEAGGGTDLASVRLEFSGPLSLFRRTRVYGRALASLIPHLCWCSRFELRADLSLGEEAPLLRIAAGAPIFPAKAPKPFDSKLEARFARDFSRVATDWDLHREPAPVTAGNHLIFPDFALEHRRDPRRTTLLEIAGFWTADYVSDKLRHLREAGIPNLILCIDEQRDCGSEELPKGAHIIRYRRRIDPQRVVAFLELLP